MTNLTQPRWGIFGQRYGSFTGKGAAGSVDGPYCAVAGEVFVAGAVGGEVYLAGAVSGEVFVAGAEIGEAPCE